MAKQQDSDGGIHMFFHCATCLNEKPDSMSPADYARLGVGVTVSGDLVVTCYRHSLLVAHFSNKDIGEDLFKVASQDCDCGQHDKETVH